jgi:alpha-1,3-rhamnosyl/mannosyltransferase
VSTVEPRKNIANLLRAYETLPSNVRARVPLVLCGDRGWISEEIHVAIERARREQWLRYFGYIPEEDLPLIYGGARVFIYPSFYEGFGLPVLEAMASGVPVVAANSTSIPEVAGDCALLVEPNAIGELADAVERSLDDEDWRERVVASHVRRSSPGLLVQARRLMCTGKL